MIDRIALKNPDGHGVPGLKWLLVGTTQIMFEKGKPIACFNGNDLFYPDGFSPAAQKFFNAAYKEVAHIRVPPSEFAYIVAAALIPQLRPLTRVPQELV